MERDSTFTFDASAMEAVPQAPPRGDVQDAGGRLVATRRLVTERCAAVITCSGSVADAREDTT